MNWRRALLVLLILGLGGGVASLWIHRPPDDGRIRVIIECPRATFTWMNSDPIPDRIQLDLAPWLEDLVEGPSLPGHLGVGTTVGGSLFEPEKWSSLLLPGHTLVFDMKHTTITPAGKARPFILISHWVRLRAPDEESEDVLLLITQEAGGIRSHATAVRVRGGKTVVTGLEIGPVSEVRQALGEPKTLLRLILGFAPENPEEPAGG